MLSEVEDMDDDRSVGSSRDGSTSQVIDEKDLDPKISVTEEAKLNTSKRKNYKIIDPKLIMLLKILNVT